MYELEDTEKGWKMLSSEHDSHCNRNHTAASVTCSEPAQDWTSYQSIMDADRPINLYSIFLGGGVQVCTSVLSGINGSWERGNHYLQLCTH